MAVRTMENEAFRKRRQIGQIVAFMIIGFFLAYPAQLLGATIEACQGASITEYGEVFAEVFSHPLQVHISGYTVITVLVVEIPYVLLAILYLSTRKKFIAGSEYGTAEWADPTAVSKQLTKSEEQEEIGSAIQVLPISSKILSEKVRISYDGQFTHLNNNTFFVGGPGKGKSMFALIPNLLKGASSYVVTDPKGQLLHLMGGYLEKVRGYKVLSLNLVDFKKSDRYNPFRYVKSLEDLLIVIEMLISTTTPADAAKHDPFWEKSEGKLLKLIMRYQWFFMPPEKQNFRTTVELAAEIYLTKDGKPCKFTQRINELELNPQVKDKSIVFEYKKFIVDGPEETVRCVLECLDARLEFLKSPELLRILSDDDMALDELGSGVGGDPDKKIAIFCVTSDVYKTYNPIASLLYMQIFKSVYFQADNVFHGPLPVELSLWLDEFVNIGLPKDFLSYLSTCRSRNISIHMIVQNIPQLKKLYGDSWSEILGGCSAFVYLGGNEPETYKLVSEMLGKGTYDKRSWSKTTGSQGHSSSSEDVIGRELLDAAEVRRLDYNHCIVFIEGFHPILDNKFPTFQTETYKKAKELSGTHIPLMVAEQRRIDACLPVGHVSFLSPEQREYYLQEAEEGHCQIYHVTENGVLIEGPIEEKKPICTFEELMDAYSLDQQMYALKLLEFGVKREEILAFLKPEYSLDKMGMIGEILLEGAEPEAVIARYRDPMVQNLVADAVFDSGVPMDIIAKHLPVDHPWTYKEAKQKLKTILTDLGIKHKREIM